VAVLEFVMKHFNIPAEAYSCMLHAQSKWMFKLQSNYTILVIGTAAGEWFLDTSKWQAITMA